jgi:hypothetical protein
MGLIMTANQEHLIEVEIEVAFECQMMQDEPGLAVACTML